MKIPTPAYVYVFHVDGTPYYKIGFAKDVQHRQVSIFGTLNPFEIITTTEIYSNDGYRLEAELHRRYNDKRVGGEFFALGTQDVAAIVSLGRHVIYTQPRTRNEWNGVFLTTTERLNIIEQRGERYRRTAKAMAQRTGVHWLAIPADDVWSEIAQHEQDIDDLLGSLGLINEAIDGLEYNAR